MGSTSTPNPKGTKVSDTDEDEEDGPPSILIKGKVRSSTTAKSKGTTLSDTDEDDGPHHLQKKVYRSRYFIRLRKTSVIVFIFRRCHHSRVRTRVVK